MKTGKARVSLPLAKAARWVSYSPDGKPLATGHDTGGSRGNGSIMLWDTRTWTEKTSLLGHSKGVAAAAVRH